MLSKEDESMLDLNNRMVEAAENENTSERKRQWWSLHAVEFSQAVISLLAILISIAALIVSIVAINT